LNAIDKLEWNSLPQFVQSFPFLSFVVIAGRGGCIEQSVDEKQLILVRSYVAPVGISPVSPQENESSNDDVFLSIGIPPSLLINSPRK
jgi:hypothetical protein